MTQIFRYKPTGLILLAFIAFISLGLPDGLLGVAWPSIRGNFSRPLDSLGLLLIAGTIGYFISSFSSGGIMARLGIGGLLAVSCAATGFALIGYTLVSAWWTMIALGIIAGLGAGAIDAGINTYIASNFGDKLMQWLHASWGIGVTLGPIIMTIGINLFNTWRWGYFLVGTAQLLLAFCFVLTISLWRQKDGAVKPEKELQLADYKTSFRETLHHPSVWLSMVMFFLYTGIESTLGNWTYTLLTESRGVLPKVAGLWAGSYWATFTVGRVLAGFCTRHIGIRRLLHGSLLAAFGGLILFWWNLSAWMSFPGIVIIGLAIAPIFPGLVSETSERVGLRYAANTIGMQLGAAGFGSAILPGFAGVLARRISLEIIPVYLIILAILLFGLYRLSIRSEKVCS